LFDGPAADSALRQRLRNEPAEALYARLAQVDPAAAARIHVNDAKRLVRALEVYELTGRPISSYQTDWAQTHARHDALWFGLLWDREALNRRINARVKAMVQGGWVAETRRLLERYGELSRTAAQATGYAELIGHVQGRLSLDDAVEEIKIATRQLARRQMKWFKRFPRVQWLAGDSPLEEKIGHVVRTIRAHEQQPPL
jgi:tRNA dimethylallyltransferase